MQIILPIIEFLISKESKNRYHMKYTMGITSICGLPISVDFLHSNGV